MHLLGVGLMLLLSEGTFTESIDPYNVPESVKECFQRGNLNATLEIYNRINPFYLRGDFDGDRKFDYAVLVTGTATRKRGIVFCLSKVQNPVMIGAGIKFVWDDDLDFSRFAWTVFDKEKLYQGVSEGPPPRLVGDAIKLIRPEASSGLVYWNKREFAWYQLED